MDVTVVKSGSGPENRFGGMDILSEDRLRHLQYHSKVLIKSLSCRNSLPIFPEVCCFDSRSFLIWVNSA